MNLPVFGIPSFGIPAFGIPVFGIPDFGIPVFGIPVSGRVPVWGFPYLRNPCPVNLPVFGIPTFGIPAFGIPTFGISAEFRHPLMIHPLDSPQLRRRGLGLPQQQAGLKTRSAPSSSSKLLVGLHHLLRRLVLEIAEKPPRDRVTIKGAQKKKQEQ